MMRKIFVLGLIAFLFVCISCGSHEDDVERMFDKMKNITDVMNKAAEDEKVDEGEVKEIEEKIKEFKEFNKEMEAKYKGDESADKKAEKYMEEHKEDIEKIQGNFTQAMMKLIGCEGGEKLELLKL